MTTRLPFSTDDVRDQCAQFGDAPLAHPLPVKDLLKMCDRLDELERGLLRERNWSKLQQDRAWQAEARIKDLERQLSVTSVSETVLRALKRTEAAEAELERVRTAYTEESLENERIKESLREILYGPRNADGRSEQIAT